jgi:hypothetical protein
MTESVNNSTAKVAWPFQDNATTERIAFLGDVFWNRNPVTRKSSRYSAAPTWFKKHSKNEVNDNGFVFRTTVAL